MSRTKLAMERLIERERSRVAGETVKIKGRVFKIVVLSNEWALDDDYEFGLYMKENKGYPDTAKKAISWGYIPLNEVAGIAKIRKGGHYVDYYKAYKRK